MNENQIKLIKRLKKKQEIKRILGKMWKYLGKSEFRSVILNYHSIHPTYSFSTKPVDFQKQIELLQVYFKVISLSEFHNLYRSGTLGKDNYAIIAFDDGYEDNFIYAFPIIKKFKIKPTIFIVTGFVNKEIDITKDFQVYRGLSPLSWKQIKEMSEYEVEFGSHTHSHPNLVKIDLNKVKEELIISKDMIESQIKKEVVFFAYPWGQLNYFNSKIVSVVKYIGYNLACSTLWGNVDEEDSILTLPRIRIDPWDTLEDFKAKILGEWDYIKYFQVLRSFLKRFYDK